MMCRAGRGISFVFSLFLAVGCGAGSARAPSSLGRGPGALSAEVQYPTGIANPHATRADSDQKAPSKIKQSLYAEFCADVQGELDITPAFTSYWMNQIGNNISIARADLEKAIASFEAKGPEYERPLRESAIRNAQKAHAELCRILLHPLDQKTLADPNLINQAALLDLHATIVLWHAVHLEERNSLSPDELQLQWERIQRIDDVVESVRMHDDWLFMREHAIYLQYILAIYFFDLGSQNIMQELYDKARARLVAAESAGVADAPKLMLLLDAQVELIESMMLGSVKVSGRDQPNVPNIQRVLAVCTALLQVPHWGGLYSRAVAVGEACDHALQKRNQYQQWLTALKSSPLSQIVNAP